MTIIPYHFCKMIKHSMFWYLLGAGEKFIRHDTFTSMFILNTNLHSVMRSFEAFFWRIHVNVTRSIIIFLLYFCMAFLECTQAWNTLTEIQGHFSKCSGVKHVHYPSSLTKACLCIVLADNEQKFMSPNAKAFK